MDPDGHRDTRPGRPTAGQMAERGQRVVCIPQDLGIPTGFHRMRRPRLVGGDVPDVLYRGRGFPIDDMRRSEFPGELETRGDDVDGDDGLYAQVGGGEDGGHADGSAAVDGDGRVWVGFQAIQDGTSAIKLKVLSAGVGRSGKGGD